MLEAALQFALPASDTAQFLSSPSSGKARPPERAALWAGMGSAAPHGTWAKRPFASADNRTGQGEQQCPGRPRRAPGQGLPARLGAGPGPAPAASSRGVACTRQAAQGTASLAAFPVPVTDRGSAAAAANRETPGRRNDSSGIKPQPENSQSTLGSSRNLFEDSRAVLNPATVSAHP